MTLINFCVRGACVDEQVVTSGFTGQSLTLSELRALFPFEGEFHFRQKVDARGLNMPGDYVWMDLCGEEEKIRMIGDSIEIVAVALSLPDIPTASYEDYYTGLSAELAVNGMGPTDRPMRKEDLRPRGGASSATEREGSAAPHVHKHLTVENVTKAASSIWSSVVSTASTLQSQYLHSASGIPEAPKKILDFLRAELTTAFDDSLPAHAIRIQDLWESIFPNEPFQRVSPKWRIVGFQKEDPILDLKNGGILPLLSMSYFCQQYTSQAQAMISAQKENKKTNYPFAIVCVNITLLLADLLGLRDQK